MKKIPSPIMVLVAAALAAMIFTGNASGQAAATPANSTKPKAAAPPRQVKSGVDEVIELFSSGASESMIISTLRDQGKPYILTVGDVLKLRKAGVSENVIHVMKNPKAPIASTPPPLSADGKDTTAPGGAAAPSAPPPATIADASTATPFPPDLPNTPTVARKRRVVVDTFKFGAAKDVNQGRFDTTDSVGQGLRALLMSRLQKSTVVTVLERSDALLQEQQMAKSSLIKRGTQVASGGILGADCIVTGDITTFGRDDKTKTTGGGMGGILARRGGLMGAAAGLGVTSKEEKAVVAVSLRITDAETSTLLESADARGESLRKSKSLGIEGLGGGSGGIGGGGFGTAMTSSGFQQTILGEATMDAIEKIVKQIEDKVANLPQKPRNIEGRVAAISTNGVSLAMGGNVGVLEGDRFAILQITNTVLDPQTKEPIDVEAVKVGELVVSEVREKIAVGAYGGQPLQADYITGKGYMARLMTK
jgi:curli biogenesis system outer membrane secretion channel CsgG